MSTREPGSSGFPDSDSSRFGFFVFPCFDLASSFLSCSASRSSGAYLGKDETARLIGLESTTHFHIREFLVGERERVVTQWL